MALASLEDGSAPGHGHVYRTSKTSPDQKKERRVKRKPAVANEFLVRIFYLFLV